MCVCIHTLQLLVSWCSGFLGPIPSGKGIGTKPPNHYRWWFQRFFPQFSPQNWGKGSNLTMRIVFQRLVKPPTRFTITLRILTPLKGLFWGHIYTPAKEQVHSLLHWRVQTLILRVIHFTSQRAILFSVTFARAASYHVAESRLKRIYALHPGKLRCFLKINGWFRCISYV